MMLPSIVMSLGVILIGQSPTGPTCPVTISEKHATHAEDPIYGNYGNGAIWTMLYPDGKFVGQPPPDGSLRMKFPWWRLGYTLTVEGRRLDAPAPPLRSVVPNGYRSDFQASALFFPMAGCWEITAKSYLSTLTFVTLVLMPQ